MVVWLTPKVKQGVLTAVCRSRRPAGGLHSPGMARIEIERRVLKQNLTPEKIQALQLAQSVRAGSVRRFDATQLQLADELSVG
jgi:hypothetical protein